MLLHLSKLLVTLLMVLFIHGSPVIGLPTSTDDITNDHEIERVEIYHIVEAWIDNFFTGWRSERSTELQNVATEIAKLSEIAGQKPTKGLYLAAATGAMTFNPTSSSTPSTYKLLKHTAPV